MQPGLTAIDNRLKLFANEIGATISMDETKGMWLPDKSEDCTLNWTKADFHYSIAIYPTFKNGQIRKWGLGAWCTCNREHIAYSAHHIFIETRTMNKVIGTIDSLLKESLAYLMALKFDDLKPIRQFEQGCFARNTALWKKPHSVMLPNGASPLQLNSSYCAGTKMLFQR